jgi:hypothetical protein
MTRTAKLGLWTITAGIFLVVVMWAGRLLDVPGAVADCLRPTAPAGRTYLPQGCTETNEAPPPDLLRIVQNQQYLYGLVLQNMFVCRSAYHMTAFEARPFGLLGLVGAESDCRPLYSGCCSCQIGRHVIVMAGDPSDNGSVIVQANLLQNRWDHLRFALNKARRPLWLWWWPLAGTLFLLLTLRRIVMHGSGSH